MITITHNEKLTQEDFTKFMDAWLNNFEDNYQFETLFQSLVTNHPTLQQNFWRVMERVILRYSDRFDPEKGDRFYDDRSAASVRFCKRVAEYIRENHFYFPCV